MIDAQLMTFRYKLSSIIIPKTNDNIDILIKYLESIKEEDKFILNDEKLKEIVEVKEEEVIEKKNKGGRPKGTYEKNWKEIFDKIVEKLDEDPKYSFNQVFIKVTNNKSVSHRHYDLFREYCFEQNLDSEQYLGRYTDKIKPIEDKKVDVKEDQEEIQANLDTAYESIFKELTHNFSSSFKRLQEKFLPNFTYNKAYENFYEWTLYNGIEADTIRHIKGEKGLWEEYIGRDEKQKETIDVKEKEYKDRIKFGVNEVKKKIEQEEEIKPDEEKQEEKPISLYQQIVDILDKDKSKTFRVVFKELNDKGANTIDYQRFKIYCEKNNLNVNEYLDRYTNPKWKKNKALSKINSDDLQYGVIESD